MNGITTMNDNSHPSPSGSNRSGLNRLKLKLEKGTPSLSRRSFSNLDESNKHQQFFTKPSIMNLHRRQRSVDEVIYDTQRMNLSSSRSKSSSPKKLSFPTNHFQHHHKHSSSANSGDINMTPEIQEVSNFSSPTKSILSSEGTTSPHSPVFIPDNSQGTVPKISISEPKDENLHLQHDPPSPRHQLFPKESNSRLGRFKKKTMSMFFDQGGATSSLTPLTPVQKPAYTPQRPTLSKSHSENDGTSSSKTLQSSESGTSTSNSHGNTIRLQQDLNRKRSKTLGSVENDLYHKRNGSIVKAIGSMMLLKPRNSNPDSSSASVSQLSVDSDINPSSREHTPPPVFKGESPEQYVNKLLEEGFEFEVTSILSLSGDDFLKKCLHFYICEKFHFHNVPLDIALRKFLMSCELPKEAQQIDRVLDMFSVRYYQCNIELWDNSDQIYFLTFSLVMLHTDYYNVNNKKKMTKDEFVKNTRVDNGESSVSNLFLTKEILEYFYDNTIYTKFVHYHQIQQHPSHAQSSQTIYSLPKRIFSSTSSANLENMNRQPSSSNLRSQSFSSTTSQIFSSAPVIDPYHIILTDQLDTLKLDLDFIHFQNPFEGSFQDFFHHESVSSVRQQMLENKGLFIRYNKDCNWLTSKTEIQFKNPDEIHYEKRVLLKVIKADEIYREETIVNNKFFTIGSTSRVVWKKYYAFLTTCGLFMFDSLNFLSISEREKIVNKDFGDEPFIVEILLDFILRGCLKYSLNGLFACTATDDESSVENCFHIFSTNRKELFSTNTAEEMSSWICSTNYLAALDSCYIDTRPEHNHEVVPLRNTTMEEKISKLEKNKESSIVKVNYYLKIIKHLQILTPFSHRTREYLISHVESLGIKIDWLWYEIERNMVYLDILRHETIIDDKSSVRTKGEESFLEESFINDDYYKQIEKHGGGTSKRAPLMLVSTPEKNGEKEEINYEAKINDYEKEEEEEEEDDDDDEQVFVDAFNYK